jgi:ketosteroid isomerase-like protein
MSQENVEVVRRFYDALNRGDWDAVFRDTHPDFELTTQRLDAGTHRRREAVQGIGEDYIAAFDNMVFEPEGFFENGDQVLVLLTRRARPKGSSTDIVVRNGHLFTVRDGTILSMKSFPDPEEALEAVGLREEAMSQENVEVVRRSYEAFNENGLTGPASLGIRRSSGTPTRWFPSRAFIAGSTL